MYSYRSSFDPGWNGWQRKVRKADLGTEIPWVANLFQVQNNLHWSDLWIPCFVFLSLRSMLLSHYHVFIFVLSQHRTKTEQGPNSAWNLISLPENAQCLVQWFEQQWSGKDTLQSVELKTVWLPVGRRKQRKMMESGTRTRKESGKREFLSPLPPLSFPPLPLSFLPPSLPLSFPYSFFFSPLLCHWAIMDGNYGWLVNSKHHLLCISPLFNYRLAKEWISSAVLEGSCAQRTLLSFRTSRCKLI